STVPVSTCPGLGGIPPTGVVPRPPRPRSRLGRVTFSLLLVAIGVLAAVHLAGAQITPLSYVAVALAVIGLGLLIGAWFGRARWLIAPGLVLALVLTAGSAIHRWSADHPQRTQVWQPTTVAEIEDNYQLDLGSATLDLSHVDFTDHDVTIDVHVKVGNLLVTLPPTVDATVE